MIGFLRRQSRLLGMRAYGRGAHRGGGLILMYHRVSRAGSDPWGMAVAPEVFAGQMEVLARSGLVCPLSHLVAGLKAGKAVRGVAVTFDDGYLDNLTRALPVLERLALPATVYVTSGAVGVAGAFWWDRLQRIFLESPDLPARLSLPDAAGEVRSWELGAEAAIGEAALAKHGRWRADHERPRGIRQRIFLELWAQLAAMPAPQRAEALARLDDWAGSRAPPDERPMTGAELRRLAAAPGIEIGGHTRTHVDLSRLSAARGAAEIADDRAALRSLTGQEVTSFALPFGRQRAETGAQIRVTGYVSATTSRFGLCDDRSDLWALPRLQVADMPVATFAQVIGWLTGGAMREGARERR